VECKVNKSLKTLQPFFPFFNLRRKKSHQTHFNISFPTSSNHAPLADFFPAIHRLKELAFGKADAKIITFYLKFQMFSKKI